MKKWISLLTIFSQFQFTPAFAAPKTRFQNDVVVTGNTDISGTLGVTGTTTIGNGTATGSVRVGSSGSADSKAVLDLVSTTKGLLPPRMTTVQRDAITSPTTGLTVYNTNTNKMNVYNGSAWAEVGSGSGAGGINYIQANNGNEGAENDTNGWSTYDDGSAVPVDGSGGSVAASFARTTTNPLRGVGSFLYTPNTSGQGEGFSYSFSIDPADKAKNLLVSFDFTLSGTITEGDYTVYIYDLTNGGTPAQVIPHKLSGTSGTHYTFRGTFQSASNSTSYRLIVHQAVNNPGGAAVTLKTDNFSVGPQSVAFASPISDWTTCSMTIVGGVSNPTKGTAAELCLMRKNGGNLDLQYSLVQTVAGTAGTGNYLFTVPNSLSIDSTRAPVSSNQFESIIGTAQVAANSDASSATGYVAALNSTQLVIVAASTIVGSGSYALDNGTVKYHFTASIPIQGWSSSTTISQSDSSEGRPVVASYSRSTTQAVPNATVTDIVWTDKDVDTFGMMNTSTGVVTIPVPGQYEISVQVEVQPSASGRRQLSIEKNGSDFKHLANDAGSATGHIVKGSFITDLVAGDQIKSYLFQDSGGSLDLFGNGVAWSNFSIRRVTGNQSITAAESVNARYTHTAGQSIPDNTYTIVDYETLDYSTHGNVTTGAAWKFTVNSPGKYDICARSLFDNGGGWAANETAQIFIYKNGSEASVLDAFYAQAVYNYFIHLKGCDTLRLVAGDYIDIRVLQNSGASLSINTNPNYSNVSIKRVGN
jgi:hypothetical protein